MNLLVAAPSLSDRLADRLWQVTIGIVLLVCVVYVSVYGIEWRRRIEIQHLLADAQALRVGVTTADEVRELSQKYGGKFLLPVSGATDAQASICNIFLSNPQLEIAREARVLPGRRLWDAVLVLAVRDGLLRRADLRFIIRRSDGFLLFAHTGLLEKGPPTPPEETSYLVTEPRLTGPAGEPLDVELRLGATAEERKKAFDFNLSCLTGLRECRHVCEVMPSAWRDLPLERRIHYDDGREKRVDEECRQRIQ
jgi:hypothetical protein